MPYAAGVSGHYCRHEINEIPEDFVLSSAKQTCEWDYDEFFTYHLQLAISSI